MQIQMLRFGTHDNPGCAFAAILNVFMKGPLVTGPNICPKMSIFLIIYDPKNRVFDQKHTFGEIVMSKNRDTCIFSEKKTLREQPQTKNSLKVLFREFGMSKILEICIFSEKKTAGASDRQK